jgi:hypothetical protein
MLGLWIFRTKFRQKYAYYRLKSIKFSFSIAGNSETFMFEYYKFDQNLCQVLTQIMEGTP